MTVALQILSITKFKFTSSPSVMFIRSRSFSSGWTCPVLTSIDVRSPIDSSVSEGSADDEAATSSGTSGRYEAPG